MRNGSVDGKSDSGKNQNKEGLLMERNGGFLKGGCLHGEDQAPCSYNGFLIMRR